MLRDKFLSAMQKLWANDIMDEAALQYEDGVESIGCWKT
jgi:hypothetical protein